MPKDTLGRSVEGFRGAQNPLKGPLATLPFRKARREGIPFMPVEAGAGASVNARRSHLHVYSSSYK